jgi:hypothetical protein
MGGAGLTDEFGGRAIMMTRLSWISAACAWAMLCASVVLAQPAGAPAAQQALTRGGAAQVRSPEITSQGAITFRLSAPSGQSFTPPRA